MEHHCIQCGGVLLKGGHQQHFSAQGFGHLGCLCSRSCGYMFLKSAYKKPSSIGGKGDLDVNLIEHIKNDNLGAVQELVENYSPEEIPVQYCRSKEMFRLLVQKHKGDPYAFIGKGRVALEECLRYFNVGDVMREMYPLSDDREIKKDVEKALATINKDGKGRVEFNAKSHLKNRDRGLRGNWKKLLDCLLWNGVIPEMGGLAKEQKQFEDIFFRKYNYETFVFWNSETEERIVEFVCELDWFFYTITGAKEYAIKTADSFPLLILQPSLLYFVSRRPVNDMSMFKTTKSNILNKIPKPHDKFFPVTRYAAGMTRSLFYEDNTEEEEDAQQQSYCGTFYYLEPESMCFLRFDNPLVVLNKTEAKRILSGDKKRNHKVETWQHSDLFLFPQDRTDITFTTAKYPDIQTDRDFYSAFLLKLYSEEDQYDKGICKRAYKKGYDGIILTHMVGSRQIVSEVLDTRPRLESFQNLYFVENN